MKNKNTIAWLVAVLIMLLCVAGMYLVGVKTSKYRIIKDGTGTYYSQRCLFWVCRNISYIPHGSMEEAEREVLYGINMKKEMVVKEFKAR